MWRFREIEAGVKEFHGMAHPKGREVWLHCWKGEEVGEPRGALVLGSSQKDDVARAGALEELGIALVKRRSGGGSVLVQAESLVWIDVFIPRDDPLWEDDIGKSAVWVGEVWQETLAEFGVSAVVYQGRYQLGNWGNLVCFAGQAPGEVFVEGRKSIGISQRRTREGARFQTALARQWDITDLSPLLNLSSQTRTRLEAEAAAITHPLPLPPSEVFNTFCATIQKNRNLGTL